MPQARRNINLSATLLAKLCGVLKWQDILLNSHTYIGVCRTYNDFSNKKHKRTIARVIS